MQNLMQVGSSQADGIGEHWTALLWCREGKEPIYARAFETAAL